MPAKKRTKKPILNPPYLDDEEREIMEAYKRGEFVPVGNFEEMKAEAEDAARRFMEKQRKAKKEARINIRLSGSDLDRIKHRAEEEGLPYQTLISSILHKFATGRLDARR